MRKIIATATAAAVLFVATPAHATGSIDAVGEQLDRARNALPKLESVDDAEILDYWLNVCDRLDDGTRWTAITNSRSLRRAYGRRMAPTYKALARYAIRALCPEHADKLNSGRRS